MAADLKGRQLLKETVHELVITAGGRSLEEAVGNIFQTMRKQIFKEFDRPIIQMEAREVYFEDVTVKKEIEKFLFFFMPREKVSYAVKAKVAVNVKYLDVTKEEL